MTEHNDISDDIRAAIAETNGAQEATETIVETASDAALEAVEGKKTTNHGPDGKFVAKQAETAQDTTEQPKTVETPQESIRPPASWSAQAKADFAALPPHIQKEVSKREGDIDKGFRERAEQLKRYEPLESVIAPHRQKWSVAGVDEATAVKQLLAASDWLDRNPTEALTHLARQYGVNIASLGQPQAQSGGGTGQPQAQPDPVANEIQALKAEVAALRQGREQETQQTYVSQIEAFAADPANLYFENVKPAMAKLLQSGLVETLPEAYERAIWADPTIRPLLLQQQTAKPAVDPNRAVKAKLAGASVTGSPGNNPPPTSTGTIEDDIRLAISQAAGRA